MLRNSWKPVAIAAALLVLFLFGIAMVSYAAVPQYGYTVQEDHTTLIDMMDRPDDAGVMLFSYYGDVRVVCFLP